MIPAEYSSIAKPVIEIRGLEDNELIREVFLKEFRFCNVFEVVNFGMLEKYQKPEKTKKSFVIDQSWFTKYLQGKSACWLEIFYFSPIETLDNQIIEDVIVSNKYAQSKGTKYLPVLVCPDNNAFSSRISNIRNASKVNLFICEGPADLGAIARYN